MNHLLSLLSNKKGNDRNVFYRYEDLLVLMFVHQNLRFWSWDILLSFFVLVWSLHLFLQYHTHGKLFPFPLVEILTTFLFLFEYNVLHSHFFIAVFSSSLLEINQNCSVSLQSSDQTCSSTCTCYIKCAAQPPSTPLDRIFLRTGQCLFHLSSCANCFLVQPSRKQWRLEMLFIGQ